LKRLKTDVSKIDVKSSTLHELHRSQLDLTHGAARGCGLCGLILRSHDLMAAKPRLPIARGTDRIHIASGAVDDPEVIDVLEKGDNIYGTFATLVFTPVPESWRE
jgi:hypothetical protein